jgi:hypothetical protein
MNHADIEEQEIVDRYVMGKLPAAEAERFEQHYLSCPECLDQLDLAESMQRGFKRAAGEDVARLAAVAAARQLALVAWLSRLRRSRQMAVLAMAVFVVAVLPAGLALREAGERGRELEQTRSALEQEKERSAAGARQEAEAGRLRAALATSRNELARAKEARARTAEELKQARRPQGNVPILALDAQRSAGPAEDVPTVILPPAPGWIVLSPLVTTRHPSYRVVLRDAGGREIWRGDGFGRDDNDALTLALPAELLAPGDYVLAVEGLAPGGRPTPAGRFAFRVKPAAG